MDNTQIINAYRRYAPFYDVLFGRVFKQGRVLAAEIINQTAPQNAKILEGGVGTGLSLPHYRSDLQVTGIDISKEMLSKAQKTATLKSHANIRLLEMNAENIAFADNYFDCVASMYVVSVVSNLEKFLHEITRVCKPGGDINLVGLH